MQFLAEPTVLGWIIVVVAIAAWELGHWQGGGGFARLALAAVPAVTVPAVGAPAVAVPSGMALPGGAPLVAPETAVLACADWAGWGAGADICRDDGMMLGAPARSHDRTDQSPGAFAHGLSLGDLHAEITAYRRQEQVLVLADRDGFDLDRLCVPLPLPCR